MSETPGDIISECPGDFIGIRTRASPAMVRVREGLVMGYER
jgi:hypothetical protein